MLAWMDEGLFLSPSHWPVTVDSAVAVVVAPAGHRGGAVSLVSVNVTAVALSSFIAKCVCMCVV